MPGHKEYLRILSGSFNVIDLSKLTDGHAGSLAVLTRLVKIDQIEIILLMDIKHLYGEKIWELYSKICGQDIDRLIYHVKMELPCQICGRFSIMGIDQPPEITEEILNQIQFRTFGKPGSFWALEHPPKKSNYEYPIQIMVFGMRVRSK
jgi:hypothetical protein